MRTLSLLLALLAGAAVVPAAHGAENAEYAVVIVIDACRPEYLANAEIPNIKSLAAAGVTYDQAWVGHLVNNTPPSHAVIATGCLPKRIGVPHFSWRNPETGKMMAVTREPNVSNGELAAWMRKANCPMIADFVKKRYPDGKTAAVGSAKYYAVGSLGGASADYVLYASRTAASDSEYGMVVAEGKILRLGPKGQMAPESVLKAMSGVPDAGKDELIPDSWAGEAAVNMAKQVRPRLMFVNFPQTDHVGHSCGGVTDMKRMVRVVENVDAQIGKIIQTYKDLGIFDKTVFVVTADHGMQPNTHEIRADELAKIAEGVGANPAGAAGAPWIWLDNPEKAEALARALVEAKKPLITAGYKRVKDASGYRYEHVADIGLPEALKKAHLYLLSTFASAQSPDAAMFWAEDTVPLKPKAEAAKKPHGDHINATWHTQAIPMIFAGAGVAKGKVSHSPARLVDVGPTVLAAMGIRPAQLDGIVLADALAEPGRRQVRRQARISQELAAHRDALKSSSSN